jgi:release factor glutamine methyltransferase
MNMNSSSTIHECLISSQEALSAEGIISARIDSLIILELSTKMDRAKILANPDQKLSKVELRKLKKILAVRLKNYPIAYIKGEEEFYGRNFIVDKSVLIPRPETEEIIQQIVELKLENHPVIADIGTGSGCIGITLKLEIPDAKVDMYDISNKALKIAKKNAKKNQAMVGIYKSDLLKQLKSNYDLIVANLPYVPKEVVTGKEVAFEPESAVFADNDGMAFLEDFWTQIEHIANRPKLIVTESLDFQHHHNESLAKKSGYRLIKTSNLTQIFIVQA